MGNTGGKYREPQPWDKVWESVMCPTGGHGCAGAGSARDSSGPELQGKARLSPELCICDLILKSSFLQSPLAWPVEADKLPRQSGDLHHSFWPQVTTVLLSSLAVREWACQLRNLGGPGSSGLRGWACPGNTQLYPRPNSQLCTFGSHSLTDSHYCAAPHSQTHCSVGRMGLRKENTCLFTQLGCEGPHTMPEGLASIPTDRLSPVGREYMAHTGTCSAHFQPFKHIYLPNTFLQLQLPHKERGLQATQGTFISRDPGSHTVTQKMTLSNTDLLTVPTK